MSFKLERSSRYTMLSLLAACAWSASLSASALPTDAQSSQKTQNGSASNLSGRYDPFSNASNQEEDCLDDNAPANNAPLNLNMTSSLSNVPAKTSESGNANNANNPRLLMAALDTNKSSAPPKTTAQENPRSSATPAPVAATVAQNAPAEPRVWEIAVTDKTLNAALARWTSIAGWQLSWELPVDYAVEVRTSIPGSFEQAVETVAKSMEGAEIPMQAIFYNGNKVLRIVQRGAK